MKYQGLDGRQYSIQPTDYIVYKDDKRQRSALHLSVRELVTELFPCDIILEEVRLPVDKGVTLVADFLVPSKKLLIEAQGEQHYKYNTFFYKSKYEFALAKQRDKLKAEWCKLNNIKLVELPYNEQREQWTDRFA